MPVVERVIWFGSQFVIYGANCGLAKPTPRSKWKKEEVSILVLDAGGEPISKIGDQKGPFGFVLSDDQPFSETDLESLEGCQPLSLGEQWLQGHACISIIHHLLD